MAKQSRSIPVGVVVTTGLEVAGTALLLAAGWVLLGVGGLCGVLGGFCLALSYSLTRKG